jgi:hypothetical protein
MKFSAFILSLFLAAGAFAQSVSSPAVNWVKPRTLGTHIVPQKQGNIGIYNTVDGGITQYTTSPILAVGTQAGGAFTTNAIPYTWPPAYFYNLVGGANQYDLVDDSQILAFKFTAAVGGSDFYISMPDSATSGADINDAGNVAKISWELWSNNTTTGKPLAKLSDITFGTENLTQQGEAAYKYASRLSTDLVRGRSYWVLCYWSAAPVGAATLTHYTDDVATDQMATSADGGTTWTLVKEQTGLIVRQIPTRAGVAVHNIGGDAFGASVPDGNFNSSFGTGLHLTGSFSSGVAISGAQSGILSDTHLNGIDVTTDTADAAYYSLRAGTGATTYFTVGATGIITFQGGSTLTISTATPTGACVAGSMAMDQDGTTGTTFYQCIDEVWVATYPIASGTALPAEPCTIGTIFMDTDAAGMYLCVGTTWSSVDTTDVP